MIFTGLTVDKQVELVRVYKHLPDTEEAAAPDTLYPALYDSSQYWPSNASLGSPLLRSSYPEDPNIYIYIHSFI